jgi:plastocyanin
VLAAAGTALALPARAALAQDQATPPPQATPPLGPRADGTTVWRVQVGGANETAAVEMMAYLPSEIVVNAGDAIWFDFQGFHTVTFLHGGTRPPVLIPDASLEPPVATPQAGVGQIVLNPAVILPSGGTSVDGSAAVNVPAPQDPTAPPAVLTFPTEGVFDYQCLIHPMMKGKVTVQAKGTAVPQTQAGYDQAAAQAVAEAVATAKVLAEPHAQVAATAMAGGATTWEVWAGVGDDLEMLAKFLPDRLAIKRGDTVRWTYGGGDEPHTVTFLGGTAVPQDTIPVPQAGGAPKVVQNPQTFFAQGEATFGGTGYRNSGYLGVDPSLVGWSGYRPLLTYELTFTTPGDFDYYCVLHGDPVQKTGMLGTISVS